MKYLKFLTYLPFAVLTFAAGWLVEWWNSPISRPLCLDRGGDLLPFIFRALPDGYIGVWITLFSFALVPSWAIWLYIGAGVRKG